MKKIIIIATLVCLIFSMNTKVQLCHNRISKNRRCITQDKPVCGIYLKGSFQEQKTFANNCMACEVGRSSFTVEGRCEDFPKNIYFCPPKSNNDHMCIETQQPACGWLDNNLKCHGSRCYVDASNRCEACQVKDVLYTTEDYCKPILP